MIKVQVGDIIKHIQGDFESLLEVTFVTDHHAYFQDGTSARLSDISQPHFVRVTSRWEILLFRAGRAIIWCFSLLP